ncbi:hypothetical protein [Emcibacter sp. SYSU 3D8]|uniref:hypothetical protein n=1 Tax=Emcibacter sp. SYSU 3D8 TaxID=3133969 RepID=UPI0031FEB6E9
MAAALFAATGSAWAQFDPTIEPDQPAQPAPPSGPAIRQTPLGSAPPAGGEDLRTQGVYQQGLDTLDPSSPGILNTSNGGFPASMWRGTERPALVALLPRMSIGKGSPAMRSLAERLLLSQAQVPEGDTRNVYDVFQARIDRLSAAGYGAEIADLFGRVPEKIADASLSRARVDALLLTGDADAACDEALSANQRSEEASWLETVAYCKLLKDDADGAAFAADMLRETGAGDADFFALLGWLALPEDARSDRPELANDQPLTPLGLVMRKATGSDIESSTLEAASPVVLVTVANDTELAPDLRLEAAERAARAGAIGARDLAAAYAGMTLEAPDLADPVAAAAGQPGGRGNALLYQAAMQATDPVAKLSILQAAWARARADGTYLLAARVNAEATKSLLPAPVPPEPEPGLALADQAADSLADGAPISLVPDDVLPAIVPEPEPEPTPPQLLAAALEIARAQLVAGDIEAARAWYAAVQDQAAGGNPNATATQIQLWPLMVVADADTGFDEPGFEAWWQAQSSLAADDRRRRGTVLMAVLEGLGQPAPAAFWGSLYDGAAAVDGRMPPLAVWRGLDAAAGAGRLGETVLLSLVVLGDPGPGKANPAVLGDVLRALSSVGLERDARAIALESLVMSGF